MIALIEPVKIAVMEPLKKLQKRFRTTLSNQFFSPLFLIFYWFFDNVHVHAEIGSFSLPERFYKLDGAGGR